MNVSTDDIMSQRFKSIPLRQRIRGDNGLVAVQQSHALQKQLFDGQILQRKQYTLSL